MFVPYKCCVFGRQRSRRRADHLSSVVLPGVFVCVYLIVCVLETSTVRRSRPELGCGATKSGIRDAALQVSVCQVMVGAKECAAGAVRIVCRLYIYIYIYIYMKRTCLPA